ncbi:MAG: hypothetical protein J5I41_03220 [Saprospiraceae bacterium]|nr:hypothetical protein [Saprospiraceae bacterium]
MKRPPGYNPDDFPPILGTWNRFYLVVLLLHALLIALFHLITQAYS